MIADLLPGPAVLLHLIAFRARAFEVGDDSRQASRLRKRKRAKQSGVHDAEDGGVGADAERECEHHDGGLRGAGAQDPEGMSKVLPEIHGSPFLLITKGTDSLTVAARLHFSTCRLILRRWTRKIGSVEHRVE